MRYTKSTIDNDIDINSCCIAKDTDNLQSHKRST